MHNIYSGYQISIEWEDYKMKKVVVSVYCFIFSIVMLLSPFIAEANNSVERDSVNVAVAKQVAKKFISQTVYKYEWGNSSLKYHSNFYDIDDSLLGYYFIVKNNVEELGYLIVSSTKERKPILQYGEGTLRSNHHDKVKSGKRAYYLGGLQYLYGDNKDDIIQQFNEKKNRLLIQLKQENLMDEYESVKNKKLKSLTKDKKDVQDLWNKLLLNDNSSYDLKKNYISIASTNYKHLDITRLWQRMDGVNSPDSACGPTTGAMIVNWYKSQGYWVRDSSYYGGDAKLINHLYNEMGTDSFGTSISEYNSGMKKHLNHDTTGWDTWDLRAEGYYLSYKISIDDSRPVALRFDYFVSDTADYKYHFVAGEGYDETSGTTYVAVKDPDGGEFNTGTHWISWSDNDQDMAMGLSKYIQ
jgi:hypothetical protein